jgi:hypothetical protein
MKTKHFLCFDKKRDILIPDLYIYNIKIQTNIDQNAVKYLRKITYFFEINFGNFVLGWDQPVPCGWTQQAPADF